MDFSAEYVLNVFVIIFSALAAVFWFRSSVQNIPEEFSVGWGGVGGTAQQLVEALKKSSHLSSRAALFAGLAAAAEAFSVGVRILLT